MAKVLLQFVSVFLVWWRTACRNQTVLVQSCCYLLPYTLLCPKNVCRRFSRLWGGAWVRGYADCIHRTSKLSLSIYIYLVKLGMKQCLFTVRRVSLIPMIPTPECELCRWGEPGIISHMIIMMQVAMGQNTKTTFCTQRLVRMIQGWLISVS